MNSMFIRALGSSMETWPSTSLYKQHGRKVPDSTGAWDLDLDLGPLCGLSK